MFLNLLAGRAGGGGAVGIGEQVQSEYDVARNYDNFYLMSSFSINLLLIVVAMILILLLVTMTSIVVTYKEA